MNQVLLQVKNHQVVFQVVLLNLHHQVLLKVQVVHQDIIGDGKTISLFLFDFLLKE